MSDTAEREPSATARLVLAGLTPNPAVRSRGPRHLAESSREKTVARNLFATVPLVLVGTMAMSLTGPVAPVEARPGTKAKASTSLGGAIRQSLAAANTKSAQAPAAASTTSAVPKKYTVTAGDTVSSIATRFGVSTASVLALNGLGWKSIIHPGQVLVLSKASKPTETAPAPTPVSAPTQSTTRYTVVSGDTVSKIAKKFGVTAQSVLSLNKLSWSSTIYPGQKLSIPTASSSVPSAPPVTSPAPTPTATSKHVIRAGETVSSIAKKYGVSVNALLSANNLVLSSIIYAGQSLVIPSGTPTPTPAPAPTPGSVPASNGGTVAILGETQMAHARTIISVGRSLGVSDHGIVIALATAMQESAVRNLSYGHLDSVGLFQQRPSMGWGTVEQLTNPEYATKLFYGGPSNPNKGLTRGLLDIPGWQSMTVAQAAQKVQVSGHPHAYAQWETSAKAWLSSLG